MSNLTLPVIETEDQYAVLQDLLKRLEDQRNNMTGPNDFQFVSKRIPDGVEYTVSIPPKMQLDVYISLLRQMIGDYADRTDKRKLVD